jgi:hypothetical protein
LPFINCNHSIRSTTTVVRLAVLMMTTTSTSATSSLILSLIEEVLHRGTLDTSFWLLLSRLVEHHGVIVLLLSWLALVTVIDWNRLSIVPLRSRLKLLSSVVRVRVPCVLIEIETCFAKAYLLPDLTLDRDLTFRRLVIRIEVSEVCLCEHVCFGLRHCLLSR